MIKIYFRKTKTALHLLILLMVLFTVKLNAQCPTGNIVLTTQAAVNQFKIDYPNCTSISGNLQIGAGNQSLPSNITDLSPLGNITHVQGTLYIQNNGLLLNVDGLKITTVGGFLYIGGDYDGKTNLQLKNLNGLSSLTSVAQDIYIRDNPQLTDISALQNTTFKAYDGYGLTIIKNPALAVCNLPNFCTYLTNPANTHPRSISGNLTTCLNEVAVKTACGILSVTDIDKSNITVYPNPVKSVLNFSEEVSNIKIMDLSGRTIKQISTSEKAIDVSKLKNGIYIITATTKRGNTITKKLVKE